MRGLETNPSRYFILVEFHGFCWVDPRRPRADAVGESVYLDKRALVDAKDIPQAFMEDCVLEEH